METKYSIIIPHYNSPDSLEVLLNSIPKNPDIQVIVVDDNSTQEQDLLEQVIKNDSCCEFYKNITGVQSAGACRNVGLTHAKGKWVLFADADDYFVDKAFNHLEEYYNESSDVVYFPPTSINMVTQKRSNRHILYERLVLKYHKKKSERNEFNLIFRMVIPWSRMIKREVIVQNKIEFEAIPVSNDVIFSTKLGLCISSPETSDKTIYCVTRNRSTLTTAVKESNLDVRVEVFIRKYTLLRENLTKKQLRRLDVGGENIFSMAITGFGLKKLIQILKKLRRNNVKLFAFSFLNMILIVSELKEKIVLRMYKNKIAG